MKQKFIVRAYEALSQITSQKFESITTAKELYFLKKKLKDIYEFQREEEEKIFEAHPNLNPSNMQLKMSEKPTPEELQSVMQERKEIEAAFEKLANQEHELDIKSVEINSETESIKFSPDDLEALEGFVEVK